MSAAPEIVPHPDKASLAAGTAERILDVVVAAQDSHERGRAGERGPGDRLRVAHPHRQVHVHSLEGSRHPIGLEPEHDDHGREPLVQEDEDDPLKHG